MRPGIQRLLLVCLVVSAVLSSAAPVSAQGLTATPPSVTLSYTPGHEAPGSAAVGILGATAPLIVPGTFGPTAHPNLFAASVIGNDVYVGTNFQFQLNTLPLGSYSAALTVTDGSSSIQIPVTLNVGTVSSTFSVSPVSVTIPVPVGVTPGTATASVTSAAGAVAFTLTEATHLGGNWLTVTTNSNTTPATLTISANPAGLGIGTYTGIVTATPTSGTPVTVNVSMVVGGTALTASPNPIYLTYVPGQAAPAGTTVNVGTSATASTFTASVTSGASWLLVNGAAVTTGAVPGSFTVTINPSGLTTAGQYTGTIQVLGSDGSVANVSVEVSVASSAGLVASPSTMSFISPGGTTSQTLSVSTGTTGTTNVFAFSSQQWLSVTPASIVLPGASTFSVSADPTGLNAGTYTGTISLYSTGAVATVTPVSVSVTLTVGGGGGVVTSVAPTSLSFHHYTGGSVNPPPHTLVVRGSTTGTFSLSFTPTGGTTADWIQFSQTTGATPADILVTAVPTGLGAGAYTGTITVVAGGVNQQIPATLTVYANPILIASPGTVVLHAPADATADPSTFLYLLSSASGTEFPFTVSPSVTWLGVSPASGVTSTFLIVTAQLNQLTPGMHVGSILVSGTGSANGSVSVPVVVTVGGTPGSGFASPAALVFSGTVGSSIASRTLAIDPGFQTAYTAQSSASWLQLSQTSGTAPATLTVTAVPTGLAAGTHTAVIAVTAGGVTQNVNVTLNLSSGAVTGTLQVDPVSFTADYQQGDPAPAARTLAVSSSPSGLGFSVSSDATWLSVSPTSGTTAQPLTLTIAPGSLSPGTHAANVTITSPSAASVVVPFTLNVRSAPQLLVGAEELTFSYRVGNPAPAGQPLNVTSSGSPLGFTANVSGASWLTVTPNAGTTPATLQVAINPAGLNVGTHTGTVTLTGAGTPASTRQITVRLAVSAPLPTVTRVSNAASYVGGFLAPGEIVVLQGTELGPAQLQEYQRTDGRIPVMTGGTRVLFNGVPGPVLYSRADQVSAIVPFSLAGRSEALVQVEYRGQRSNVLTLPLAQTAPGIFALNASGAGPGAILNQDYSVNLAGNGAVPGSVVAVYATGGGQTSPASVEGTFAAIPDRTNQTFTAEIGGLPARVLYAGSAPGLPAGALQVNVEVPATLRPGEYAIFIRANNVSSQPGVTVTVR